MKIISSSEHVKDSSSKPIVMIDKETGQLLKVFCSGKVVGRWLGDIRKIRHVSEVCNGKRKTAYGYKWASIIICN